MTRALSLFTLTVCAVWSGVTAHAASPVPDAATEWHLPGHDPASTRFSPLRDVDAANVTQLKAAFTFCAATKRRCWSSATRCTW